MIILIDAYNFLKSIAQKEFVSDRFQKEWLDRFNEYSRLRGNRIVVVFDAGPGMYQLEQRYGKVQVVYSGQMKSADDVLKEFVLEYQGKDVLLVTSDREICEFADMKNITSIGSQDFYTIFTRVVEQEERYLEVVSKEIHKTSDSENDELDMLMEEASRDLIIKDFDEGQDILIESRDGKKVSKMDRRLLRKIEKI